VELASVNVLVGVADEKLGSLADVLLLQVLVLQELFFGNFLNDDFIVIENVECLRLTLAKLRTRCLLLLLLITCL